MRSYSGLHDETLRKSPLEPPGFIHGETQIEYSELTPLFQGESSKWITTFKDKDGQSHLGILYDTIEQLRADNADTLDAAGRFKCLKQAYQDYVMLLEQGEKVIILRFICKNDKIEFLKIRGGNNMASGVHVSDLHMELAIAFKFGLRYYLSKDGETFSQSDVMHIDKSDFQGPYIDPFEDKSDLKNFKRKDENPGLLILPYSDDQYALLKGMHDRLYALNSELMGFLNSFVDTGSGVDVAITPDRLVSMGNALKRLAQEV